MCEQNMVTIKVNKNDKKNDAIISNKIETN